MPALSREDSTPSSQRSLRARRKPCGGGPAGVAERCWDVEKVAAAGEVVRAARMEVRGFGIGRACANLERERIVAMLVVLVVCGGMKRES